MNKKIKDFLINNKNIILIIILILIISIIFIFINLKNSKQQNDSHIIGMNNDVKGFDPTDPAHTQTHYSYIVLNLLHSRFITRNEETNELIPGLLAELPNKDQKKLTCKLKDNIFFHNNKKITSDDVVYTFERAHKKNHKDYKIIEKVKRIDDRTFELYLKDDNEYWTDPFIRTIAIISKDEMVKDPTNGYKIGSGTYKLKEYLPKELIQLEPFEKHYDKKNRKNIEFKISPDDDTLIQELENNDIHAILDYKTDRIKDLRKNIDQKKFQNMYILENESAMTSYIYFNKRKTTPRVREIISRSLDIQKIIDQLNLPDEIANTALHNKLIGYDPNINYHENLLSQEEAKKKVNELSETEKKLCVPLPTGSPKINEKIIAELRNIGFDVNPIEDDFNTMISKVTKEDSPYNFSAFSECFETKFGHKYFEDYFKTNDNNNNCVGIDQEDKAHIEDKINKAKRHTSNDQIHIYKKLMSEIEQYLKNNHYLLPIKTPKSYVIVNKKITEDSFKADIFGRYYNMNSISERQ